MKTCIRCNKTLNDSDFGWRSQRLGKRLNTCKACRNVYAKSYYEAKGEQQRANVRNYKKLNQDVIVAQRYGISREKAAEMLAVKVCAICGSHNDLHVDHCHTTGVIRGRLCKRCNIGLGFFLDNEHLLISAAGYLRKSRQENAQVL